VTKERVAAQMEETRRAQQHRSRKWEEKEKVLGHLQRSDVSRPRAQLAVTSLSDFDLEGDEDDVEEGEDGEHGASDRRSEGESARSSSSASSFRMPFATRLWGMRLAVQRGYRTLQHCNSVFL